MDRFSAHWRHAEHREVMHTMGTISIRVMGEDDWALYRALRLQALQESPESFYSTYLHERDFTDQDWVDRIRKDGRGRHGLPLMAEVSGEPAGLALGLIDERANKTASAYQTWVSPAYRGLGVGRALLEQIISWAETVRMDRLKMLVPLESDVAVGLATRCGFLPSGEILALRPGSAVRLQPMMLQLR